MIKKKYFSILILFLFLIGIVSAGNYIYSNPKTEWGTPYNSFNVQKYRNYDKNYCQEGQDFIIQVAPTGCTPAVVRSDLLEEEDVDVFCQIQAIKINPLVNVDSISSINFKYGNLPMGVRSVAYHPSRAALNRNGELNGMAWNNIGYIVITIAREVNESAMSEFISGNIVADIRYKYNREDGFGRQTFYLPEINDKTFEKNMGIYSFFLRRGYIRASNIDVNSAEIGVYSGRFDIPRKEGSTKRERINNLKLKKGESERIILLGQECGTSVNIKLDDVVSQGEMVKLSINSEVIELVKGEKFLEDKCTIRDISRSGVNQAVEIRCSKDIGGSETFTLYIAPKVILDIDGIEKEYSVGEKIYEDNNGVPIYLGYSTINGESPEGLKVGILRAPLRIGEDSNKKLTENELKVVGYLMEKEKKSDILSYILSIGMKNSEWLISGTSYKILSYKNIPLEIYDKKVSIVGLGGGLNKELQIHNMEEGRKARESYGKSIYDYETLLTDFFSERDIFNSISSDKLSEKGLKEKIKLAKSLSQNKDVEVFCKEFDSSFPESISPNICINKIGLANEGISTREVVINGNHKIISLENIYIPGFQDYGATIGVKKINELGTNDLKLLKNTPLSLNDKTNDFIEILKITSNSARVKITTYTFQYGKKSMNSIEKLLIKGKSETIGKYVFVLRDINLNQMAKVTVNAQGPSDRSQSNLTFKVGIEKRAIQLSPEQTKNKIDKLNKTIANWEKISGTLGGVVEGMKTACLAAGTTFTIKNLILNSGGKSVARKEVMKDWKKICSPLVASGKFKTLDGCYFNYADSIEKNVTDTYGIIKKINSNIDLINKESLIEGSNIIDPKKALKKYSEIVEKKIDGKDLTIETAGKIKIIDTNKVKKILNLYDPKDKKQKDIFTFENLKNIELYLGNNNKRELYLEYEQILKNSEVYNKEKILYDKNVNNGYAATFPSTNTNKDSVIGKYEGQIVVDKSGFEKEYIGNPLQGYVLDGKRYWFILQSNGKGEYGIKHIYDYNSKKKIVDDILNNEIRDHFVYFEKSIKMEKNGFDNPLIRFFPSGQYKNLVSFAPIDIINGWYAKMKDSIPSFNGIRSYDDNGRLHAFDLCNVGVDSIADSEDDECVGVILNQKRDIEAGGLSIEETNNLILLVDREISRINKEKTRTGSIIVNSKKISIGPPETQSVNGECSDFMSPKECKILFNLCDPVICPTSRCDLGGKYKVRDVIQSGIVGSLALCLPNAKEGIAVPICLTGVKAGIDSMISTSKAHRDCLEENLNTGRTVGICDERNSVYLCELLWKQAIPLAQIAIPKIFSTISGENRRGGAEYMSVNAAWDNVRDSVAFFTSSYALNSVKAFKSRSSDQGEIGSAICKKFVSMSYPKGQSFLKNLVASDSPPQFNANFDEITQNTITNPPISHYKLFYNIYSGKDVGTYYKVWLRGSETSYYNDQGATRIIASGYVKRDDYASETKDFTAPSGYKEVCIQVGEQEECGFKKVSTSFSSNFFQDRYRKEEVNKTNIKSEKECYSGSPNLIALGISSNIQEGVSDVINPGIYDQGIIRVCSTKNPGISTDPKRWNQVGNCGTEAMKCWLDIETIDDAFVFNKTESDLKKQFDENYNNNFIKENNYLDENFTRIIEGINNEKNLSNKIKMIDNIIDKFFKNENNAYVYYLRAGIYGEIARNNFNIYIKNLVNIDNSNNKAADRNKIIDIYDIINSNNFVSGKIDVNLDGFSDNMCFKFDKEWHWRKGCKRIITNNRIGESREGRWNSMTSNNDLESNTNTNLFESDFIKFLINKNYKDGFKIIVKKVLGGGSSSNYIKISNTKMDGTGLFTLSNVANLDNLYFRNKKLKDKGNFWIWGYQDYLNENKWKYAFNNSNVSYIDYTIGDNIKSFINMGIRKIIPSINVYIPNNLDKKIKNVPEEYKYLINELVKKDFDTGTFVLFSDKEIWEKLNKKNLINTRKWDPTEALDKLQEFESVYYNNKNIFLPEIKIFIEELIQDKLLNINIEFGTVNQYLLKENMGPIERVGDPNFGKIREELMLLQSNNKDNIIQKLPKECIQYSDNVYKSSTAWKVDPNLVWAVMQKESSCKSEAISETGCRGLMQFCEPTAKDYGLCDKINGCVGEFDYRFDANKNIDSGAHYLSVLIKRYKKYDDGVLFSIASYNGGMGLIDMAILNAKKTTGSINPKWSDVETELTQELLESKGYSNKKNWNIKSRIDKIDQIKNYVIKVSNNLNSISSSLKIMDTTKKVSEKKKETLVDNIINLNKKGWPIKRTLDIVHNLSGKYSKNENNTKIVNLLCQDEILSYSICKKVKGNSWFWTYDMDYVWNQLKKVAINRTNKKLSEITNSEIFKKNSSKDIENKNKSCNIIKKSISIEKLNTAQKKVLATAKELEGISRDSSSTNCYDATQYIYGRAGVITEGNCVYSDVSGTKYFNGNLITQSKDGSKAFYSNKNCKKYGAKENVKLDGIKAGDSLNIAYNDRSPHSVIFIEWENRELNMAKIFDWNAPGSTYGYSIYDLSDNVHPVYMYWEPKI